jgi:D-3-phosphoglycerate dehydrogenase
MLDLSSMKVLVTPTSYAQHDPTLRSDLEAKVGEVIYNDTGRPLTALELMDLILDCDGYIAGLDEINRDVIEAGRCLKVIARYGVGIDNIDMEAARNKGVVVTNTPGANSASVAEFTVALILLLARPILYATQATQKGEWPRVEGKTLEGKTIGLIGFGSIGRQVARRLAGFGCRILAYDPYPDKDFAKALNVQIAPQEVVVKNADFLSLHCPLTLETEGMVNGEFLKQMKQGAMLINTARGELVEEAALVEALRRETLAGAALDVFATQPPGANSPLLSMPQIIATPHMGSHTDGATNSMGRAALNDCLAVLRGEDPVHSVVQIGSRLDNEGHEPTLTERSD